MIGQGSRPHEVGPGRSPASSEPVRHSTGWLGVLRDFSPFAFGKPDLEQQYQIYLNSHGEKHVGTTCVLITAMWIAIRCFAWYQSMNYTRLWVFNLPLALCIGICLLQICAPGRFRRLWRVCSLVLTSVHVMMGDEVAVFIVAYHTARDRLHVHTLWEIELHRLVMIIFLATALPHSLPAWALAQVPMFILPHLVSAPLFANTDFSWAVTDGSVPLVVTPRLRPPGNNHTVWEFACPPIPWPVSALLDTIVKSYLGPGAHVSESAWCRWGVEFWKIQAEIIGAFFTVVRDITWRRSFLRSHPQLIGPNGAVRAAAWPFAAPHIVQTCFTLFLWLTCADVLFIDFRLSAIVGYDVHKMMGR